MASNYSNYTCSTLIPKFDVQSWTKVLSYSVVFGFSAVGNIFIFLVLVTRIRLGRASRVNHLLFHLNIADLFVTLYYLPKEILHTVTVSWNAGDVMCKVCKFFDIFGPSLSSYILIILSMDRCACILHPLYTLNARRKIKLGIITAWIFAALSSVPQIFLFTVAMHPCDVNFHQCVTLALIGQLQQEYDLANSLFSLIVLYFLPFLAIVVCYGAILFKMLSSSRPPAPEQEEDQTQTPMMSSRLSRKVRRKKSSRGEESGNATPKATMRSTNPERMQRAANKTLKMTIAIVVTFLVCWTPYFISVLVHFKQDESPDWALFFQIFCTLNSCLNPYLYGYFSMDIKREVQELSLVLRGKRSTTTQQNTSGAYLSKQHIVGGRRSNVLLCSHDTRSQRIPASNPSSDLIVSYTPQKVNDDSSVDLL